MKYLLHSINFTFLSICILIICINLFPSCSKSIENEFVENIEVHDNKIGLFNGNELLFIYESKDQQYYLIKTPYFTMLEFGSFTEIVPVFGNSSYRESNFKGTSPDIIALNKYIKLRSKYFLTDINDVIRLINCTQITYPEMKNGPHRVKVSLYPQHEPLINNLKLDEYQKFINDRILNFEMNDKRIREYFVNTSRNNLLIENLLQEGKKELVDSIPSQINRYYQQFQSNASIYKMIKEIKFLEKKNATKKSFNYVVIPNYNELIVPVYRFEIDSTYKGFEIRKFLLNDEIMYNSLFLSYL